MNMQARQGDNPADRVTLFSWYQLILMLMGGHAHNA